MDERTTSSAAFFRLFSIALLLCGTACFVLNAIVLGDGSWMPSMPAGNGASAFVVGHQIFMMPPLIGCISAALQFLTGYIGTASAEHRRRSYGAMMICLFALIASVINIITTFSISVGYARRFGIATFLLGTVMLALYIIPLLRHRETYDDRKLMM